MRVVFLAGRLSRRASGVRQMVEGLSGALCQRGVDLHVLGLRDEAWDEGDCNLWTGASAQVFSVYGPDSFGFAPGLRRALDELQPDIVHLHGLWMYSAYVASKWAEQGNGALVISPHGMLAPKALTYSKERKWLARYLFQDRCFTQATGFHATAEAEAEEIRSCLGEVAVSVIPNGVRDTDVLRSNWTDRARRIVALGRLHPVKGYDLLIRAWCRIESDYPDWSLEIGGPDPDGYGEELRRLALELGLQRVTIGPALYGTERDAYFSRSRLFALPSLSENFALTVPEALLCGTPVIASTGAPWKGLVDNDCGWWVPPEIDAFAATISCAIHTPDDRMSDMGNAGRAWVLNSFGWENIARKFVSFYIERIAAVASQTD